jgi:hypothetical protein
LKTSSSDGSFTSANSRLSNINISFVSNLNASFVPSTASTTRLYKTANDTNFFSDMDVTKMLNETFEPASAIKDMTFSNMDVTKMINESFSLADETANKGNSYDLNVTRMIHDHGMKKDSAVGNEDVITGKGKKLPSNIADVTLL